MKEEFGHQKTVSGMSHRRDGHSEKHYKRIILSTTTASNDIIFSGEILEEKAAEHSDS